jgi:hypothetical protein
MHLASVRSMISEFSTVDGPAKLARRTIRDASRASDMITRLRTLYSKKDLSP